MINGNDQICQQSIINVSKLIAPIMKWQIVLETEIHMYVININSP